MTSKEFLSQAYLADKQINIKFEQLERLHSMVCSITVSYGHEAFVREAICYMIEKEDELDRDIDRLVALKTQISEVIDGVVNPKYHRILEERYLSFKTWRQIADDLQCDPRWVRNVHDRALGVVDRLLEGWYVPTPAKGTTAARDAEEAMAIGPVRGTGSKKNGGRIVPY